MGLYDFKNSMKKGVKKDESEGQRLYAALADNDLSTFRIRKSAIEKIKVIDSIIIIGSSWCGKTTIRNIFDRNKSDTFSLPKRVVTREQRPNDNLEENEFTSDLFSLKKRVKEGYIWKRDLGEKIEYYGFEEPKENTVPIYSANNALIREKDSLIGEPKEQSIQNALILLVYAPDRERLERNRKRESVYLDDKPEQKKIRSLDSAMSMYTSCHLLVKNSNSQDLKKQEHDLKMLLGIIVTIKRENKKALKQSTSN
jgi:guanylate kinase